MAEKQVRGQYTLEYKLEAGRQVRDGQAISMVVRVLGVPKASLDNWVRLTAKGGNWRVRAVRRMLVRSPLSRPNWGVCVRKWPRLRMERDVAKKTAAYFVGPEIFVFSQRTVVALAL